MIIVSVVVRSLQVHLCVCVRVQDVTKEPTILAKPKRGIFFPNLAGGVVGREAKQRQAACARTQI